MHQRHEHTASTWFFFVRVLLVKRISRGTSLPLPSFPFQRGQIVCSPALFHVGVAYLYSHASKSTLLDLVHACIGTKMLMGYSAAVWGGVESLTHRAKRGSGSLSLSLNR